MATEMNTFGELNVSMQEVLTQAKKDSKLAFKAGDYNATSSLLRDIEKIEFIKKQLASIEKDYTKVLTSITTTKIVEKPGKRSTQHRGKRTKEAEFIIPILKSINELGGSGKTKDVLKKVNIKMKKKFNDYDVESLPSIPSMTRWKQTAQMARITMVKDGLLRKNSPRGVWEITEKGKKAL